MRKNRNHMRVYVLMLSKAFPKEHAKAGQWTYFEFALKMALERRKEWLVISGEGETVVKVPKLNTIRTNYERWEKRIKAIQEGKAELSIRQWKGRPYEKGNVQIEIARLGKNSGIGIEKLFLHKSEDGCPDGGTIESIPISGELLAINDGLGYSDWRTWFKDFDEAVPLPIIHFTKSRYGKQE